jgi:hypothetical protein
MMFLTENNLRNSFTVTLLLGLFLASFPGLSVAGIIQVDTAVEDKGTVTTVIGHNEFTSSMTATLHAPDWGERAGTYSRGNREVFVIDTVITEHFFNIYPLVIDVPQPVDLMADVTIPFFMATGTSATDLHPLQVNGSVDSAEMRDGEGTWHEATMSSFFDIFVDLPLLGPNGEQYQWDLSGFTETQGNFYLAEVTMTTDQFSASVPEPSTLLLLIPMVTGIWYTRKAKKESTLQWLLGAGVAGLGFSRRGKA